MNLASLATELQGVWSFLLAHLWETTLVWVALLWIAVAGGSGILA